MMNVPAYASMHPLESVDSIVPLSSISVPGVLIAPPLVNETFPFPMLSLIVRVALLTPK